MLKIIIVLIVGAVSLTASNHVAYVRRDGTKIIPDHRNDIVLTESDLLNSNIYVRRSFYDSDVPDGTLETLEEQLRYYIDLRNYILFSEQRKGIDTSNYQSSGGDRFGLGALISSLVSAVDRIRNEVSGGAGDFRNSVKH